MAYESWVDRQIREAMERGEFDNLPGAGKPIEGLNGRRDDDWWIKNKLKSEGLKAPLPEALALRKEREEIQRTVASLTDEDEVRTVVAALNRRIRESHLSRDRLPAVFVRTLDVEQVVAMWRAGRPGNG